MHVHGGGRRRAARAVRCRHPVSLAGSMAEVTLFPLPTTIRGALAPHSALRCRLPGALAGVVPEWCCEVACAAASVFPMSRFFFLYRAGCFSFFRASVCNGRDGLVVVVMVVAEWVADGAGLLHLMYGLCVIGCPLPCWLGPPTSCAIDHPLRVVVLFFSEACRHCMPVRLSRVVGFGRAAVTGQGCKKRTGDPRSACGHTRGRCGRRPPPRARQGPEGRGGELRCRDLTGGHRVALPLGGQVASAGGQGPCRTLRRRRTREGGPTAGGDAQRPWPAATRGSQRATAAGNRGWPAPATAAGEWSAP